MMVTASCKNQRSTKTRTLQVALFISCEDSSRITHSCFLRGAIWSPNQLSYYWDQPILIDFVLCYFDKLVGWSSHSHYFLLHRRLELMQSHSHTHVLTSWATSWGQTAWMKLSLSVCSLCNACLLFHCLQQYLYV